MPEPPAEAGPGPPLPQAAPSTPTPQQELARLLRLAAEHEAAGRLDEADALLGRILSAAPDQPAALHLSGITAWRKGRITEAIGRIERAVGLAPKTALFHRNLCEIYRKVGRYDEALASGRRAVELDPGDRAAHHNLSVLHYHRLEFAAAVAAAEAALAIDAAMPGAHFGIAEACLVQGDFERGWSEYEWRFRLPHAPRLTPANDRPLWDGKALPPGETLLLIADQGYGDVIQFARYIGWAASRCSNLAVACSREMSPVVTQQPGVGQIFDRWEEQPEFAAYCALSSLPRLAGTRLDTIPADIPYLRADTGRTAIWADRLSQLLPHGWRRIGIVWAGRRTHGNDDNRSMPMKALAPLAGLPGVALVSLQKGPSQAEIGNYWGRAPLVNLGPEIADFGDTMAIIDNLELVVTVDTAVAHLAGAMGKPVWVMLPHAPDWRWLLDRTDSPWYPTARLFRQSSSREWEPLVEGIAAKLADGIK